MDEARMDKAILQSIRWNMGRLEMRQAAMDRLGLKAKQFEPLLKGWVEYVGRLKPELFVTITFRRKRKDYSSRIKGKTEDAFWKRQQFATKRFRRFFKHLNKPGETYFQKYLRCWVCFEGVDEDFHIHALISGIDASKAGMLEQECDRHFGNSKVVPFDYNIQPYSAINYMVEKYFFRNIAALDYFKINSRLRKEPKVYWAKPQG